jgi:hypothetical protein
VIAGVALLAFILGVLFGSRYTARRYQRALRRSPTMIALTHTENGGRHDVHTRRPE